MDNNMKGSDVFAVMFFIVAISFMMTIINIRHIRYWCDDTTWNAHKDGGDYVLFVPSDIEIGFCTNGTIMWRNKTK